MPGKVFRATRNYRPVAWRIRADNTLSGRHRGSGNRDARGRSEIAGQAFHFPIAVAVGIVAATAAEFLGQGRLGLPVGRAPRFRLGPRPPRCRPDSATPPGPSANFPS